MSTLASNTALKTGCLLGFAFVIAIATSSEGFAAQNNDGKPSAGVIKCFGAYNRCTDNCELVSRTEADADRCEQGCHFNFNVCKTAYPDVQSPTSSGRSGPPKAVGH